MQSYQSKGLQPARNLLFVGNRTSLRLVSRNQGLTASDVEGQLGKRQNMPRRMVSDRQLNSGDGHPDGGRSHPAGFLEWTAGPGGRADHREAPGSLAQVTGPLGNQAFTRFDSWRQVE